MTEIEHWEKTLNDKAKELGLEPSVKAKQPGVGEGMAVHWVYEGDGQAVALGWNVDDAVQGLQGLALQVQIGR